MKTRLTRQIRRLALFGIIAVGASSPATSARGEEASSEDSRYSSYGEWCGWGTHDSTPIARRTSSSFEQTMAAVAATATAKAGVAFEQIVEPFAMIRTGDSNSIAKIEKFQQWWNLLSVTTPPQNFVIDPTIAAAAPVVTVASEPVAAVPEPVAVAHQPVAAAHQPVAVAHQPVAVAHQPSAPVVVSTAQDDASFDIAYTIPGLVPIVDFDEVVRQQSASGVTNWRFKVAPRERTVPDWIAHEDHCFDVVVKEDLLKRQIEQLALEEPIDAGLEPVPIDRSLPRIAGTKRSFGVGSAPIIATIEEPYLAYDLPNRDFYAWLPTGILARPFCLRHQLAEGSEDPLWTSMEVAKEVAPELVAEVPQIDAPISLDQPAHFQASADCVLDEWVWQVSRVLDRGADLRQAVRMQAIGSKVADLLNQSDRLTSKATKLLASVWPEIPAKQAAAQQLLARAEAIVAEPAQVKEPAAPVTAPDDADLAKATELFKQWVHTAQSIGQQWLRVASLPGTDLMTR